MLLLQQLWMKSSLGRFPKAMLRSPTLGAPISVSCESADSRLSGRKSEVVSNALCFAAPAAAEQTTVTSRTEKVRVANDSQ